jgi:hypothetical protein
MVRMAQTVSRSRRDWWYAAGFGALAAGTGVAAVLLMSRSIALGWIALTDPQSHAERVAAWRCAATTGYTAGSGVGFACSLLAGQLLAARAGAIGAVSMWRTGLGAAVSAGAGLALVNLLMTWWAASSELARLAALVAAGGAAGPPAAFDPGLRHHRYVIVAIALVVAAYLVFAVLGYVLGRTRKIRTAFVILFVLALTAPYSHIYLTAPMVL